MHSKCKLSRFFSDNTHITFLYIEKFEASINGV